MNYGGVGGLERINDLCDSHQKEQQYRQGTGTQLSSAAIKFRKVSDDYPVGARLYQKFSGV